MSQENNRNHQMSQEAYVREDEISLYDLYYVLVKRKCLIASFVVIVLALSVIYVLLAPKIYQVSARLLPASSSEMYLTNIPVSSEFNFKPDDIFKRYVERLNSNEAWLQYVQSQKEKYPWLIENARRASVGHFNPLKLDTNKQFPGTNRVVTYDSGHPVEALTIFKQYLSYTEQNLTGNLSQQIKRYIQHETDTLNLSIKLEREAAKQQRLDSITRLESDLRIAKKLGIANDIYFNVAGKVTGNRTGVFNVFAGNTQLPTYLRGTKDLTAELGALKNRQSDDPYIPDLRKKQSQLRKLQQIQFTPDAFRAYQLDGNIMEPKHPIKPHRVRILAIAILLGGFLGIFAAFVAEFVSKAREMIPVKK